MLKRTSKKNETDINIIASSIVNSISGYSNTGKNPAAVALGKLGGLKGGKARAKKLTKEQRSEIAIRAAKARWKKSK